MGKVETTIIDAVCMIIRACGFNAMATQFKEEPDKRERIVRIIHKEICKKLGPVRANKFLEYARLVK